VLQAPVSHTHIRPHWLLAVCWCHLIVFAHERAAPGQASSPVIACSRVGWLGLLWLYGYIGCRRARMEGSATRSLEESLLERMQLADKFACRRPWAANGQHGWRLIRILDCCCSGSCLSWKWMAQGPRSPPAYAARGSGFHTGRKAPAYANTRVPGRPARQRWPSFLL
jgi:hypothetical protein